MSNIVVFGGHVLGSGGHVLGVGTGGGGTVATPTFSPVAGTYTSTQNVTITCSTGASSIYFTTDGTTPTFPITGTTTLYTGPVSVASSETLKAIGVATGLTNSAVGTAVYVINTGSTVPNITALQGGTTESTLPAKVSGSPAAYVALNVGSQAAGYSFNDPVTGVLNWKLTDNTHPGAGFYSPWYSQMGLAISQAWGPNLDQYHIAYVNVSSGGGGCVNDFGLSSSTTPGPYNWRALPTPYGAYQNGNAAFSRMAGNPDIMYVIAPGPKLRLYNVAAGVFVDSSAAALGYNASWPSTGITCPSSFTTACGWFAVNAAETWAVLENNANGGSEAFAINLGSSTAATPFGTVLSWTNSFDDFYIGYGNFAWTDSSTLPVWDLDNSTTGTNAFIAPTPTLSGWNGDVSHVPCLRGYWLATSTFNTDTLPMMNVTITNSGTAGTAVFGTTSSTPYILENYGQWHMSGYWWLQSPGANQWVLMCNTAITTGNTHAGPYDISFANPWTGDMRRLGYTYSILQTLPGQSNNYWTQAFGHISHDGKLVMYGSDMLGSTRIDVFVIEVPVTSGTPPSFP
jgi:hypothetical protein